MGVEALRTEDPEAGEEELDDDADRHQHGQAVVHGGEAGAHHGGTYRRHRPNTLVAESTTCYSVDNATTRRAP